MEKCPHCNGLLPQKAGLTPAQTRVMCAIEAYYDTYDIAPTYSELMELTGYKSKSNIHRILHGLQDRGWINFKYDSARSISICE